MRYILGFPTNTQAIVSVTLYTLVTVVGSISLSYFIKPKISTGIFFWTQATTQFAPLNATAVNPHAATALNAYSIQLWSKEYQFGKVFPQERIL